MKFNEVKLSLIVSNNREYNGQTYPAVRKVSEALTIINAFLPGKKNSDGSYGPSLNFEIKQNSKTVVKTNIASGERIDVFGFITADSYTNKDGKVVSKEVIVANEIGKTEYEGDSGNANYTAAPTAPASNAGSKSADLKNDFMNIDYSDELPFS
jgi:hypothetical protein